MKINTLKHFIKDAGNSLKRNKTLSLSSATTVMATLFILGIFLLVMLNVRLGILDVESRIEVQVFLKKNITEEQKNALEEKIKNDENVKSYTFETKEMALKKYQNQLGKDYKYLIEGYEKNNPLPESYIIKADKPESVSKIVSTISPLSGIEEIKDGKEIVDKIITATNALKWIGIGLFILLIGVSLFLIGNTIKIAVFSRRREIGIMKFIGATDWFIRWPFIMEGAVIGIAGALGADILLYIGYKYLITKFQKTMILSTLLQPGYILTSLLPGFILLGLIIGCIGSIISIKKFLDV
ncbi:MAG: permease-like cell division protein FtsX [Bacillota bacterium]|nr:permease-like cell division protein FtsX [Bacillota bacterium]